MTDLGGFATVRLPAIPSGGDPLVAMYGRRNVIRGGFSGLPGQPGPGAGRRAARGYDWRLSRRQKV
jgi:hypothetical protein